MAIKSVRKTAGKATEGRARTSGAQPRAGRSRAASATQKTKGASPRAADIFPGATGGRLAVSSEAATRPLSEDEPPASPAAPERGATAIEKVHHAVKAHQSRIFGTIFGLGQQHDSPAGEDRKDPWGAAARAIADPLGLRKFEDVFDQRVATALERLGWPTPEELRHLREQVEVMTEYLRNAESGASRAKPKR